MVDAILCWPQYADYPLWRAWLREHRDLLEQVIIVLTPHAGPDRRDWVRANLDATYIDCPPITGDWRDVAVNAALDVSTSEWVWFTEQDLVIDDLAKFWPDLLADAYGFPEPGSKRWHPASLFVRRSLIDRTSRYFGPEPIDHFTAFGRELDALTKVRRLRGFHHLQGTSQNQYQAEANAETGFHQRETWRAWLRASLDAGVPMEAGWVAMARAECAS